LGLLEFGSIQLDAGVFLAPMAGLTDFAFRSVCKTAGAEMTVTEMMSAAALVRAKRPPAVKRVVSIMEAEPNDRPLCVQLFGNDADELAGAAAKIAELGADAVDLNLGCPAKKVICSGSGAALARDAQKAVSVFAAMRKATDKPLSAKIRIGWDQQEDNSMELAKGLADAGCDMLIVHGRPRSHGMAGPVDLQKIRSIVSAVSIPVVGNGEVACGDDAEKMIRDCGCGGVMIGRAAVADPFVLGRIRAHLAGEPAPAVDDAMRRKLIEEHFALLEKRWGERIAAVRMRPHAAWLSKGRENAASVRRRLSELDSADGFQRILDLLFENREAADDE